MEKWNRGTWPARRDGPLQYLACAESTVKPVGSEELKGDRLGLLHTGPGIPDRAHHPSPRSRSGGSASLGCVYTVVVGAWRRRPASLHHDDPTAVGVGDVVESKKLPRTPTNQRASDLIDHGLDLDVTRRERRGNKKEEAVAGFLGLEVSGGPRNEFGQRDGSELAHVHGPSRAEVAVQGTTCPQKEGRIGARRCRCSNSGRGGSDPRWNARHDAGELGFSTRDRARVGTSPRHLGACRPSASTATRA